MRSRFNIEGTCIGDWCGAICCPCCTLVQEEKEMVQRVMEQGYQPVIDMKRTNQSQGG
ncbi:hypothetical protein I7I51_07350 [Histoplasma capsulatum]|uniref:PLAC8 family protein n=1 Tax=Ajellomyces capsulatus TaxID=5037 RepID=A0A8A1MPD7_AJECA|nr:predicted protein [Histoplasma mississippiense (nom. inval.)]EDN06614.1 predicted protein [Histoplasma mississippiense (nom. inval.)]QSS66493.1 hypothetical protein I7I51_07350 [Histoplasma capsulatum]